MSRRSYSDEQRERVVHLARNTNMSNREIEMVTGVDRGYIGKLTKQAGLDRTHLRSKTARRMVTGRTALPRDDSSEIYVALSCGHRKRGMVGDVMKWRREHLLTCRAPKQVRPAPKRKLRVAGMPSGPRQAVGIARRSGVYY
jgi:hypothetical protein